MVAIHIPRPADDERAFDPAPGTADPGPAHHRTPDAAVRRLPDRATRVRRRRLALLVAALAVVGGGVLGAQVLSGLTEVGTTDNPQPVDVRPVPVAGQQYVVQPGDTLWSIASEIAPDADPRAVVDALRAANGGPELEVGSRLILDID
jgi:Tfp pilus assembly protein FimV